MCRQKRTPPHRLTLHGAGVADNPAGGGGSRSGGQLVRLAWYCAAARAVTAAGVLVRLAGPEGAPPAGPATRADQLSALQQEHRAGLRSLVQGLHPLPWSAPSGRDGQGGGRGVSELVGQRAQGRCVDAHPGAFSVAVPVLQGAWPGTAVAAGHRAASGPTALASDPVSG
jgi:hypothetical protein